MISQDKRERVKLRTDDQEGSNDEGVDQGEPVNLGIEDMPSGKRNSGQSSDYLQVHVPSQTPRHFRLLQ